MRIRHHYLLLACLVTSLLPSCTNRYQDLLRDRDAQIRELNGQVADLRATNADLQRREEQARDAMANTKAAPAPAEAETELGALRRELPETEVRYSRGRISIGIDNSVTFDSGSTVIKKEAERVLEKVANVLKRDFSGNRIYVEGHTDTDPIARTKDKFRDNRHLSAERADSVATWLIQRGKIPEASVAIVGFGQWDPVAAGNGTKARNRRVEIVVGERL
jgi:chemotaxis protein MotB